MKFKQQVIASAMLIMKVTVIPIFLVAMIALPLHAKEAEAQNVLEKKITLSVRNESLEHVISLIKEQTNIDFSFSTSLIKNEQIKSFSVYNKPLGDVLNMDLGAYKIGYSLIGQQIVLFNNAFNTAVIQVSGKVIDSKGVPLQGVTIKIKGTSIATSSNSNGEYTININSVSDVLVFSFVGFESQELTVGNKKHINVTLLDEPKDLNEVVVVAFGTQKKATLTGSISTITTKDLIQSPVANISNSLAGRLPGLFASQASGEPGNDQSTLRIRGVGTFAGSTAPLVMVDGIATPNYNNIDPNEIESVSILKDASATAVYGIRGANGVLLITTRRGKKGPPRINYTFNEAVNTFTALPTPMNSYNYAIDYNQALANDDYASGVVYTPKYSASDIQLYQNGTDPVFHPNINWYNVILKKYTTQQQHNLNISGGSDKVKYFVSGGYFDQPGQYNNFSNIYSAGFDPNLVYKRYNFRSNFDFQVNKRFQITVDVATQNEELSGSAQATTNVINSIGAANPLNADLPIDNKIVNNVSVANNPIANLLQSGYKNQYNNFLNGTVRINHKLDFITEGLNFRADVNYQNYNSIVYNNTVPSLISYTATATSPGNYNLVPSVDPGNFGFNSTQNKNRTTTLEYGFDYDRHFGDNAFTGLLLYRQSKLYDPTLAYDVPNGHQGGVGRVTYAFKSKYLAEFSAGYEGTENFAPGKRYGFFPSGSIGWVPTLESFFPKNKVIDFIKFRATYGIVGNDNIGGSRFLYNPTAYTYNTTGSNQLTSGQYFGQVGSTYQIYQDIVGGTVGNPNLTWERAVKVNAGVDIYMFKSNLSMTVDVFHEQRSNILEVPATASLITGYLPPAQNLGVMANKGLEAQLTYKNNIGDFNYQVSGNFSFARNKIIFESEVPQTYGYRDVTGQRYGQYYGLIATGFYNSWAEVNDPNRPVYYSNAKIQPGDIIYKDVNGDGIINDNDQVPIGFSNIPEITYGLSLRAAYKGFDMSILFQGTANVSLAYNRFAYEGFYDAPSDGALNYLNESWTPARYASGQPILFPRFTAVNNSGSNPNEEPSTMWIVNAAYLRVKNLEFGYTFHPGFLEKIALKSARVFVNANNLITWDSLLPGIDPENLPQGANSSEYPLVRTINVGVNAGF